MVPPEAAASVRGLARRPWRIVPLAAGALAVAAIALVLVVPQSERPGDIAAGAVAEGTALDRALDGLASGARETLVPGATLGLVATFDDAAGRLCREFQVLFPSRGRFEHAVACRGAAGWDVEIVVTAEAQQVEGDGYLPAAGPGSRAVDVLSTKSAPAPRSTRRRRPPAPAAGSALRRNRCAALKPAGKASAGLAPIRVRPLGRSHRKPRERAEAIGSTSAPAAWAGSGALGTL